MSILRAMAKDVELQQSRPVAEPRLKGGGTVKTSTVLVAIAVAVTVVSVVVVAVVIINRNAEQSHNSNLVRLDDEDDDEWQDLNYSEMLDKSKELRDEDTSDPNFTLLSDLQE